jgi:catechol 2,3-dioxygenase-like lactoylglutathione lyase family enzyme
MATQEMARFDAVRIGTDDLARATRGYALLLGCAPERADDGVVRFVLARGAVELAPGTPGKQMLRLASATAAGAGPALDAARAARFGGIDVLPDSPAPGATARATPLAAATPTAGGFLAVDHVVVNTTDPTRAIGLWRDTLGLRLALDREFPARGLRMLFFRSAGVTLEVVSPIGAAAAGDDLQHGVAYRVADLARVRARLLENGFDVSALRDGNKRGTLVATVRAGTEGVPTLLIEALPADDGRG